jgi:hypothetical protein
MVREKNGRVRSLLAVAAIIRAPAGGPENTPAAAATDEISRVSL